MGKKLKHYGECNNNGVNLVLFWKQRILDPKKRGRTFYGGWNMLHRHVTERETFLCSSREKFFLEGNREMEEGARERWGNICTV